MKVGVLWQTVQFAFIEFFLVLPEKQKQMNVRNITTTPFYYSILNSLGKDHSA